MGAEDSFQCTLSQKCRSAVTGGKFGAFLMRFGPPMARLIGPG